MSIFSRVNEKIEKYPEGVLFSCDDFFEKNISRTAVLKSLERIEKTGKIKRVEKGFYYLPIKSIFGEIPISSNEYIKKFLYKDKEKIGYISGNNLYNRYGLTTQLSNLIEITTNTRKNKKYIGNICIKFIETKVPIKRESIKYLEILDILKNLNKISDGNITENYLKMKKNIEIFDLEDSLELLKFSEEYYPLFVSAILGSILEEKRFKKVQILKEKIAKKKTFFKLGIKLKNTIEWIIK